MSGMFCDFDFETGSATLKTASHRPRPHIRENVSKTSVYDCSDNPRDLHIRNRATLIQIHLQYLNSITSIILDAQNHVFDYLLYYDSGVISREGSTSMSVDRSSYDHEYRYKVYFYDVSMTISDFKAIVNMIDGLSIIKSGSICTCRSEDNDWIVITESRILMLAICCEKDHVSRFTKDHTSRPIGKKRRSPLCTHRITNILKKVFKLESINPLRNVDPSLHMDFNIYTKDRYGADKLLYSQNMQLQKILKSDFFFCSDQVYAFDVAANVELPTPLVIASVFERLLICCSMFSVHKLLIGEEFPRITNATTNSDAISVQKRYIIHQSLIHPNDYTSSACSLSQAEWEKGMADLEACCKMIRLDFEEQRIEEKKSRDQANALREKANEQREAAAARQAESDSMMNFFMLLLASLTACSTLFDILDWLREVRNHGWGAYSTYAIILIVILFIITVVCISRIGNPFKKRDSGDA